MGDCLNLLCNIIWFIFGGFETALVWFFVGIICCISVIGIPAGTQCFKIGCFVLCPFGKQIVPKEGGLSGCDYCCNFFWIIFVGFWLAIMELFVGVIWCITRCGIPFGLQMFKLAKITFMPFGARILDTDNPPTAAGPAQPPIVVVQTGAPTYPPQQMGYTTSPGYVPPTQPN